MPNFFYSVSHIDWFNLKVMPICIQMIEIIHDHAEAYEIGKRGFKLK